MEEKGGSETCLGGREKCEMLRMWRERRGEMTKLRQHGCVLNVIHECKTVSILRRRNDQC